MARRICKFCESKTDPDYKESEILKTYMSERGRIIGSPRTGVCAKHQRLLTIAVKRARHLATLPFVSSI